ncbi:MAG: PD40 domain-containing protein [Deltaproteobacteria bacterium]|nr:PD40 domain-containing protein [Deltaproteobacteria bacterium]
MKTIILSGVCILIVLAAFAQEKSFDYFGLTGPGDKIELFAPGIVSSEGSNEYSVAISPLGDEVFFSRGTWPETKIMHIKKIGNRWSGPEVVSFSADCYTSEPAFSPDGKYLYFSSSKGKDDIKDYSIWQVERSGNNWDNAKKVIDFSNPGIWEFHPSITNDGTVYFCYWESKESKGSIYKSDYQNGIYSEPLKVNIPFSEKSSIVNPFVDPEAKYIIISAAIYGDKSEYDVYISNRQKGTWLAPDNIGPRFNASGKDFDVSPDGKYFFMYKQGDVYWTETKGVLK